MSLPTYNKAGRKKAYEQLPKGAYVVKIKSAKEETWPSGDTYVKIAFDIAEGEFKDFYMRQFEADSREDKKWPVDATFNLNAPNDNSKQYVYDTWNTFFADLEDSNNGFVFKGDPSTLKDKVIGGKFCNKQTEFNGNIYDHTIMKWTCLADAVRSGKPGKMPKDQLIDSTKTDEDGFMEIDVKEEVIPF